MLVPKNSQKSMLVPGNQIEGEDEVRL